LGDGEVSKIAVALLLLDVGWVGELRGQSRSMCRGMFKELWEGERGRDSSG